VVVHDISSLTDGQAADNVLGQEDFTSGSVRLTQDGLGAPAALAFDSVSGQLIVADTGQSRAMFFDVAAIVDGEDAVDLAGQYDETDFTDPVPSFTRGQANNLPNRQGFDIPRGIALDTIRHRLFVSDSQGQRILIYNLNTNNNFIDRIPDNVLGQPNFTSNEPNTSINGFSTPEGIAYDEVKDRLYVVDRFNNRVMVFDTATITDGENAVNVLGQADFISSGTATTATGLFDPSWVAIDVAGERLFVSEISNARVVVYDIDSIVDGEPAVNVLGQPDFTTANLSPVSASSFGPTGLAYDPDTKSLFVADQNGSRVLVFDATTITDNEPAVSVIGQPDFTTGTFGVSSTRVSTPIDIAVDSANDRLFISQERHRISVFDIATITPLEPAIGVLGQSDFTSMNAATTPTGVNNPRGMVYNNVLRRLFVADQDNNRLLVYQLDTGLTYDTGTFVEANANDGSISTTSSVTLSRETFVVTNGAMAQGVHFTTANVPAGLTVVVTGTSATTAIISITGKATSHESSNDISNLTVSFLDAAFTTYPAGVVAAGTKSDFSIDFQDAPTPTPTSTPTATPVPTAAPNTVGGRVVNGGVGVSNALVYVPGLGTAITDQNGYFVLEGADSSITYELFVQRSGQLVPEGSVTARGGDFVTITTSTATFNPRQCLESDISIRLVEAADVADELNATARAALSKLPSGGGSVARAIERRLGKQLNNYISASRRIPEIVLDCSGISGCGERNLSRLQKQLSAQIDNLRREALLANRNLRLQGVRSAKKSEAFAREVKRMGRNGRKILRRLPKRTYECS
jgi:DNA-binding beta-propeller fold protein YncE